MIDLDLDGTPEILFLTNKGNGVIDYALRRQPARRERRDPRRGVHDQRRRPVAELDGQIAAGNIDADPNPEIIAAAHERART